MWLRLFAGLWLVGWAIFGLPWGAATSSLDTGGLPWPMIRGRLADGVLNLVYYVPLGIVGTAAGLSPATVVIAGAALSGTTEAVQTLSPAREPSATDFASNVMGTIIGVAFGRWFRGHVVLRS